MNDFIILEGCDGVGKTTLANLLLHRGYKSLHFDYDPTLSIKEKYQRNGKTTPQKGRRLVFGANAYRNHRRRTNRATLCHRQHRNQTVKSV